MTTIDLNEKIVLTEIAVVDCTPEWALEDVDESLLAAGMSVQDIYVELDRAVEYEMYRTGQQEVTEERAGELIKEMLFERYRRELMRRTAHKVPLHTIR